MSSSNLAALVEAFDDVDDEDIENTSVDATFQTAPADKTSNETFTSCTEGNATIDTAYLSAPEDFDEDAFAMEDFDGDLDDTFTEEKPGPSTPPKSLADRLREVVAEERQAKRESSQEAAKNAARAFPFSSNTLNAVKAVPSPAATSLADKKAAISKAFGAAAAPKDGIAVFDPAFGIRVKNPKITSTTLSTYLTDHKKFRPSHLRPNNLPKGDWFTMGVIVDKSEYKKSANKNEYMIWKISDLTNFQDTPVKVLLFGECLKQHWKLQISSVVALTKPQFGEASDDKTVTLKLSKSAQVIDIGFCPDFGTCKGIRNDGHKCSQYVNTNSTEYCVYHIQKAAKSATVNRAVLGSQYNSPIGCRVTKPTVGRAGAANKVFVRPCMVKSEDTDKKPVKSTMKTCSKDEAKALRDAENEKLQAAMKANAISFGARNLSKHRTERIADPVKTAATKPVKPEGPVDFKAFIRDQKEKLAPKRPVMSSRPPVAAAAASGSFVDLGLDIVGGPKTPDRKLAEAQLNRARIAAKIREKGGLPKVDANATRKRPAAAALGPSTDTPKRSKLNPDDAPSSSASNIDIAALLGRKSTFESAINEADRAKEDAYFNNAEIKEKIESRLTELTELKDVKVVTCSKCQYTAESQSSLCMIQGHVIQRHTAVKRFFKCKSCKQRTASFARIPTKPCDGCGSKSFDRVGMRDERKVGQDNKLVIRGEERKFVNR